jgi:hypothetical protein
MCPDVIDPSVHQRKEMPGTLAQRAHPAPPGQGPGQHAQRLGICLGIDRRRQQAAVPQRSERI